MDNKSETSDLDSECSIYYTQYGRQPTAQQLTKFAHIKYSEASDFIKNKSSNRRSTIGITTGYESSIPSSNNKDSPTTYNSPVCGPAGGKVSFPEFDMNQINLNQNAFKLHIAIDFGTDGVGLAYAFAGKVFVHSKWKSKQYGDTLKPKCVILLDNNYEPVNFGADALMTYIGMKSQARNMFKLFKNFKMSLYEMDNEQDDEKKDNNVMHVSNNNKVTISNYLKSECGHMIKSDIVFIAAFKYIKTEATKFLKRKLKKQFTNIKKHEIQWIVTVPAIWSDSAKYKMKSWATMAGLVDETVDNQCKIVYEPDCASLAMQHQINESADISNKHNKLTKGSKYILVDAGGGTVDIAFHELVDDLSVKEIYHPSGGKWGSSYIDEEFIKFLKILFGQRWINEFKEKHPNHFVEVINNFQTSKASFYEQPKKQYHNVMLSDDFIGFIEDHIMDQQNDDNNNGIEEFVEQSHFGKAKVAILEGDVLKIKFERWQAMFDHVLDPTVNHIKKVLSSSNGFKDISYLCLVGGLSNSPYFQFRMKNEFGFLSKYKLKLMVSQRPMLSVVEGAAYFGVTKNFIQARRLRKSYGVVMLDYKSNAMDNGVPMKHIQEHSYYDEYDKEFYTKFCFNTIAHKNEEIRCKQVKQLEGRRQNPSDDNVTILIYCSDLEDPKVESDGMELAQLKIDFESKKETDMDIMTEFLFFDTMLEVYAFKKSKPNNKKKVKIQYNDNQFVQNVVQTDVC